MAEFFLTQETVDRYRWVGPISEYWEDRLALVKGDPVAEHWTAVPVEWLPETIDRPPCDFPNFWSTIRCASKHAVAALRPFLEEGGELLQLSGLNQEYTAFHCTREVNAVAWNDTNRAISTSFHSQNFVPVLHRHIVKSSNVFRVRGSFAKMFVSQAFKDVYDNANLTGLDFLPVQLI